jgi:hypothetical protein
MWLPVIIYEPIPYVLVIGGAIALMWSPDWFVGACGLMLVVAGVVIWKLRAKARRQAKRRANPTATRHKGGPIKRGRYS